MSRAVSHRAGKRNKAFAQQAGPTFASLADVVLLLPETDRARAFTAPAAAREEEPPSV